MTIEEQVQKLMDENQALKAWELVKDTDGDLKNKVWEKVKHAFDKEVYKKYYSEDLIENALPMELALNCEGMADRFAWVIKSIKDKSQRFICDLGCADGYVSLTLARYGNICIGVNLYKKSVDLANYRAIVADLPAHFVCEDIFDHVGKYDAVVLMEVLEHLPDPKAGIEKGLSLLREGGSLYLSTPRDDHVGVEQHLKEKDRKNWDDGSPAGHLRLFTEPEFRDLLKDYKIVQFVVDGERCMLVELTR